MLPKNAMPNAPPSSAHVSEMPEAAPARSGGAEPMMTSLVSVKSGDPKNVSTNVATANSMSPPLPAPTAASRKYRPADSASPADIRIAGRIRRASAGVSSEPSTNPSAHGSVHRPPCSGESPSTSWRYCRSEEHTSELQSPCNLVCRLLLEKNKLLDNPTTDRLAAGQSSASLVLQQYATWIWNDHFSHASESHRHSPQPISGLPCVRSVPAC